MTAGDFVQAKSASGPGYGSTFNLDAAPIAGNLLVAFITWSNTSAIATANPGWTIGTALNSQDSGVMAWKIVGVGETATQGPVTLSINPNKDVSIIEYAGPWNATPLDVEGAQDSTPGNSTKTTPALNPVDGLSRLFVAAAYNNKNNATWSTHKVGGVTTGVTERVDYRGENSHTVWDRVLVTAPGTYNASAVDTSNNTGGSFLAVFTPAVTQTVGLNGVASVAAVGQPTVQRGSVTVALNGKASTAAVGLMAVQRGPVTVSLLGIAGAGAINIGRPNVTPGAVTIFPLGVPSSGSVGLPSIGRGSVTVSLSGIQSGGQVGHPAVVPGAVVVNLSGIVPTGVVGLVTVTVGTTVVSLLGITPSGSVGQLSVIREAAGTVFFKGIPSASVVGQPTLVPDLLVQLSGIPSSTLIGTPLVSPGALVVSLDGFANLSGVGQPRLDLVIFPSGFDNISTLGSPVVTAGGILVNLRGIAGSGSVGHPNVVAGDVIVSLTGIAPGGMVGSPRVLLATLQIIELLGIDSTLQVGFPSISFRLHLEKPTYIVMDSDGVKVVVLDSDGSVVVVLDSDGHVYGTISEQLGNKVILDDNGLGAIEELVHV